MRKWTHVQNSEQATRDPPTFWLVNGDHFVMHNRLGAQYIYLTRNSVCTDEIALIDDETFAIQLLSSVNTIFPIIFYNSNQQSSQLYAVQLFHKAIAHLWHAISTIWISLMTSVKICPFFSDSWINRLITIGNVRRSFWAGILMTDFLISSTFSAFLNHT